MASEKYNKDLVSYAIKAVGVAFMIGIAWARLEYKMDEYNERLLKKIDEHILSDGFEKQILRGEITELRKAVTQIQDEAREYLKREFVRPEEPKIKRERQ